jgi:hypothetical protein
MRIGSNLHNSLVALTVTLILLPVLASETKTLRGKKIGGGLKRDAAFRADETKRGGDDGRELAFTNATSSGNNKIVGGTVSAARSFFAQGYGCGASVIWNDFMVTAAHCYNDVWDNDAFSPGDVVHIGHTRYRERTQGSETRTVKRVFRHPKFNRNGYLNDIMLVQLTQSVSSTRPLARINANPRVPAAGVPVTAMGFGDLEEGGDSSEVLRRVTVPVVASSQCQDMYSGEYTIYPNMMVRIGSASMDSLVHVFSQSSSVLAVDDPSSSAPGQEGRIRAKVRKGAASVVGTRRQR